MQDMNFFRNFSTDLIFTVALLIFLLVVWGFFFFDFGSVPPKFICSDTGEVKIPMPISIIIFSFLILFMMVKLGIRRIFREFECFFFLLIAALFCVLAWLMGGGLAKSIQIGFPFVLMAMFFIVRHQRVDGFTLFIIDLLFIGYCVYRLVEISIAMQDMGSFEAYKATIYGCTTYQGLIYYPSVIYVSAFCLAFLTFGQSEREFGRWRHFIGTIVLLLGLVVSAFSQRKGVLLEIFFMGGLLTMLVGFEGLIRFGFKSLFLFILVFLFVGWGVWFVGEQIGFIGRMEYFLLDINREARIIKWLRFFEFASAEPKLFLVGQGDFDSGGHSTFLDLTYRVGFLPMVFWQIFILVGLVAVVLSCAKSLSKFGLLSWICVVTSVGVQNLVNNGAMQPSFFLGCIAMMLLIYWFGQSGVRG